MAIRLGIDVGGTFTDLLLYDDANERTFRAKTPSTPEDQSIGVLSGIRQISEIAGVRPENIDLILHGATVATNAVLENTGARVGLLATKGFEYTLHLAKGWTPGPLFGWIIMDQPEPLARLDDTRAIAERIDARGNVVVPLDIQQATQAIEELCASGIEALTISLLHSYANPAHEQALKEIVTTRFPEIPVSLSSEILPEFREYDRAITTVMNAYVRPIMRNYLTRIENRLAEEGVKSRLHIVRSDGGLMSASAASDRPVHTILSGPAGGVTSTAVIARRIGIDKLLSFDMGGTSTDVSVIMDGQPIIARSTEVGYFPAKVPTLDIRSVGAGGGSIAEVSELTKSLRVGPRSAGAEPGPAAYGKGGTEATVSDANVTLGYLPPKLLGGAMELDVDGARDAVAKIGAEIGLDTEAAAQGILDIANETMLGALRLVTVQRGLDPREFGLVAFGGAGPLHGNALATILGCYPVIVPPNPGVLSALGFVQSEFKNEFVKTLIRSSDEFKADELWSHCRRLAALARSWLDEENIAEADQDVRYTLDLRYEQQGFEVTVDLPEKAIDADDIPSVLATFHDLHERMYGVRFDVPVELVALRVLAVGAMPPVVERAPTDGVAKDPSDAVIEHHKTYFRGTWVDTPNYDREKLAQGMTLQGPAIVRQYDTTTLILPDHRAEIDEFGNLLIWPNEGGERHG